MKLFAISIIWWIGSVIARLSHALPIHPFDLRRASQRNPDRVMLTLRPSVTRPRTSLVPSASHRSLHAALLLAPSQPIPPARSAPPPINSTVRWPWDPQVRLALVLREGSVEATAGT